MLKLRIWTIRPYIRVWGGVLDPFPWRRVEHGRQVISNTILSFICAECILNTMAVKVGVRNGCKIMHLAMYGLLGQ